jgi:enoyl-CoA hydratase
MSKQTEVALEVRGPRATVTFRTEAGVNVLSPAVIEWLGRTAAEIDKRNDVRAVVFRAEGKAFLAGADIKAMAGFDRDAAHDMSVAGHSAFDLIENLAPITVAAIQATAAGGGCELALACDFRLAVKTAKIGQPETLLGLIPGWGGTQRLARIVGKGKAIELILTGDMTTAQEAYRLGLVNKVVPAGAVLKEAQGLARKIVSKSKFPVAASLRAITEGLAVPIEEGLRIEANQFVGLADTDDIREGVSAFLEKRQPDFNDK